MNKPQAASRKPQVLFLLFTLHLLLITCVGCEAFVRKFRRKPQGEERKELPIFEPQIYDEAAVAKDELYRDYFVFWESWADELISYLKENANAKKQKECVSQGLDNLLKMQSLLNEEKAKAMEPSIVEFKAVRNKIFASYLKTIELSSLKNKIERIKTKVHRDFAFSKVKNDLK